MLRFPNIIRLPEPPTIDRRKKLAGFKADDFGLIFRVKRFRNAGKVVLAADVEVPRYIYKHGLAVACMVRRVSEEVIDALAAPGFLLGPIPYATL